MGQLIQDYRWGEALELAEQGLDRFPNDAQLLVAVAALTVQLGRPESGAAMIESSRFQNVNDPDLLAVVAELKMSGGDLMSAVHLLERALRLQPDSARFHHRLARLRFAQGEQDLALLEAARAVELNGSREDYRRFYAAMLEQAGRPEDAYEQLRVARQHSPGDAKLLLRLGDTVRREGRLSQAMEYLEMAIELDPENPLYHDELAGLYESLGALTEAEESRTRARRLRHAFQVYVEAVGMVAKGGDAKAAADLETVVEENPEFMTGASLLADIYRKLGQHEKALTLYRTVVEKDPGRARIKEETAWVHVDRGDLETALQIFRESGEENLNEALIKGYQKMVEDDWEGAMSELRKAEARYPLHPRILQQIALCLNSLGHPEEALAYLEKAHKVEPGDLEIDRTARLVRFDYALDLEKRGRWKEALKILERLHSEAGDEADYLLHAAYCRQQLWQYDEAVSLYLKGLELAPKEAWARINLATCFYALSQFDEAAEQWEVLAAASDNPEYRYHLGLARMRQWRLTEGWALVRQAAAAGFRPAQVLQRKRGRSR